MTKTDLIKKADECGVCIARLKHCQAWYIDYYFIDSRPCAVLKSYNTIVAVYSHNTKTLYEFDYYSATTCQHISKFKQMIIKEWREPCIHIKLYKHSKITKKMYNQISVDDFSSVIDI